jgi:hypothetical protein
MPPLGPPVATPGAAQGIEGSTPLCYQCGSQYVMMSPLDAQGKGCMAAPAENCQPKPPVASTGNPTGNLTPQTPPPEYQNLPQPGTSAPAQTPSCPPGQFWDGRQCRGSVASMPSLPGGGDASVATGVQNIPGGSYGNFGSMGYLGAVRLVASRAALGAPRLRPVPIAGGLL